MILKPSKIFITGIYGSGKTTLGKKLADITGYPLTHLDDVKYEKKFDKIRDKPSIEAILNEISKQNSWIIEGVWVKDINELCDKADMIVLFDIDKKTLYSRIILRYLTVMPTSWSYLKKTLKNKFSVIRRVYRYFNDPEFEERLEVYKQNIGDNFQKVITIKNNSDIEQILTNLS